MAATLYARGPMLCTLITIASKMLQAALYISPQDDARYSDVCEICDIEVDIHLYVVIGYRVLTILSSGKLHNHPLPPCDCHWLKSPSCEEGWSNLRGVIWYNTTNSTCGHTELRFHDFLLKVAAGAGVDGGGHPGRTALGAGGQRLVDRVSVYFRADFAGDGGGAGAGFCRARGGRDAGRAGLRMPVFAGVFLAGVPAGVVAVHFVGVGGLFCLYRGAQRFCIATAGRGGAAGRAGVAAAAHTAAPGAGDCPVRQALVGSRGADADGGGFCGGAEQRGNGAGVAAQRAAFDAADHGNHFGGFYARAAGQPRGASAAARQYQWFVWHSGLLPGGGDAAAVERQPAHLYSCRGGCGGGQWIGAALRQAGRVNRPARRKLPATCESGARVRGHRLNGFLSSGCKKR